MAYTPRKSQWLGTFQTGDLFTFWITTRNGAGTPTIPDACPTYQILTAGGTEVIAATKMAIRDRYAHDTSGANNCVFEATQLIDGNFAFATGGHYVIFKWRVSTALFKEVDMFNLGGTADTDGQVLALDRFPKNESDLVPYRVRSADLKFGRNPF